MRWRRQCVSKADIQPGQTVYDLMTGMGEFLPYIQSLAGQSASIRGVDFCPAMYSRARTTAARLRIDPAEAILEQNVLSTLLPSNSADRIVCFFGLKTLAPTDVDVLAEQVTRLPRPGGRFSFVEISEPPNGLLRITYIPYIRYVVPLLGFLLLGNPDNYRQLGVYTKHFGNCSNVATAFRRSGLAVSEYSLFFGCATGFLGHKPSTPGPQ